MIDCDFTVPPDAGPTASSQNLATDEFGLPAEGTPACDAMRALDTLDRGFRCWGVLPSADQVLAVFEAIGRLGDAERVLLAESFMYRDWLRIAQMIVVVLSEQRQGSA